MNGMSTFMKNQVKKELVQSFYQHNRLRYVLTLLLSIMDVPFQLLLAWMLGELIDSIALKDMSVLWRLLGKIVCMVVSYTVLRLSTEWVRASFICRALEQYKTTAFRRLSEKSISAFSRESTGRYVSVLTNDVSTIEEKYLLSSFQIVSQILLFLGALVMMLCYSPVLTASGIGLSAIPILVAVLTGGTLAKREKSVSDRNEMFVSRVSDLLGGFAVIKSFKAEKEAAERFYEANHGTEAVKRDRRWWAGMVETLSLIGGVILQFGVFFIGAWLAIRGKITAGTVVVFVQMGNYLVGPIQTVPQYLAGRKAAEGLIDKLAQLVEENVRTAGGNLQTPEEDFLPSKKLPAPVLRDAIELRGLNFAYEEDKPVLQNLSLRLEAGKKYALVGASGSGKSTLMNLLMGAYDSYEGSLTIDGRELKEIAPESLYDLMSLVGQEVFLFDDTLKRNTAMFRDFPEEKIRSAWERSGLGELVAQKGADYDCGEKGCNLSGGERQRVSIARCLLRETPVLLMDEATAALDNQTAFAVTDSILSLDGLTRLIITHRLEKALLEQYDMIFVLRDGQLQESGQFHELMEQKGYFYSLYTVANG